MQEEWKVAAAVCSAVAFFFYKFGLFFDNLTIFDSFEMFWLYFKFWIDDEEMQEEDWKVAAAVCSSVLLKFRFIRFWIR